MDDEIVKKISKWYHSMQLFIEFALKFFYFFILKLKKKIKVTYLMKII